MTACYSRPHQIAPVWSCGELHLRAHRCMGGERAGHAPPDIGPRRVDPGEELLVAGRPDRGLVSLDDALNALASVDPRKVRVVELRFFAGLSVEETADVLGVSPQTGDARLEAREGLVAARDEAWSRPGAEAHGRARCREDRRMARAQRAGGAVFIWSANLRRLRTSFSAWGATSPG